MKTYKYQIKLLAWAVTVLPLKSVKAYLRIQYAQPWLGLSAVLLYTYNMDGVTSCMYIHMQLNI